MTTIDQNYSELQQLHSKNGYVREGDAKLPRPVLVDSIRPGPGVLIYALPSRQMAVFDGDAWLLMDRIRFEALFMERPYPVGLAPFMVSQIDRLTFVRGPHSGRVVQYDLTEATITKAVANRSLLAILQMADGTGADLSTGCAIGHAFSA